jgi:hypothetical protein
MRKIGVFAAGAVAVAVAVIVAVIATGGKPSPSPNASAHRTSANHRSVYGYPGAGELVLEPPGAGAQSKVTESDARWDTTHPAGGWPLVSPARFVGPTLVTVKGGLLGWSSSPTDAPGTRTFNRRPAWVAVGEIDRGRMTFHCPMVQAGSSAKSRRPLPPLLPHYYSAVLVDAATGQVTTWEDDVSGLSTRACLGLPRG